ncbi:hypothetical protein H6G20_04345 [Desertifilum sp. FACHB-1129]|uniref:Uncharacterized protein n=2 Tax=Cyanophyceae TaxID=3028117 RepID=A0A1E5QLL3_9CYAN|nr:MULTISPECIES: hypothetical protein [Desertifilum]MDA0208713.1 hypothetical protein [Cyanobacteria bacterium FC1]MDI9640356.1 hypothetical protein [Geitlerinema splendidum]MDL5044764.1 hypothetical protein [Oscillatoria amoena NRMC-F 0135]MBD2310913.1 hypothetical protein [Desertifilum sp. FACHB-1129]MBD2321318.1 hypothetical protein [Desertifilum sp. FACHB-866]
MLYLAQVQKKAIGKAGVQLLAYQATETTWVTVAGEEIIVTSEVNPFSDNLLVLVELSPSHQVMSIKEAKEWAIKLVQDYLVPGLTPDFLKAEAERAEQWRQTLTLQSQEFGRRSLEVEARREQIQGLEENLKREKKGLEQKEAELKAWEEELQNKQQELEAKEADLKAKG